MSRYLLLFLLFKLNIFYSQGNLSKLETDSVLIKYEYNKIPESESNQAINEINNLLPMLYSDSARFILNKQKAYLYGRLGNQSMALKSHMDNKIYVKKSNNYMDHIYYYLALAEVYNNLKMYNLALENINEADKIILKNKPKDIRYFFAASTLRQISYFNSGSYDKCIKLSNDILNRNGKIENDFLNNFLDLISYQMIARSYLELKEYNKVLPNLSKAIALEKFAVFEYKFITNNTLARYYYEKKDIQKSNETLYSLKSKEIGLYPALLSDRYGFFIKNYSKLKVQDSIAFYINKKDSIEATLSKTDMAAVENSLIESKEEITTERTFRNIVIILGVFCTLILSSFLLFAFMKKRMERKRFEQIIASLKSNSSPFSKQTIFNYNLIIAEDINLETKTNAVLIDNFVHDNIEEDNDTANEVTIQENDIVSNLSDELEQQLLMQLNKFEKSKKFLNPNTSLVSLAALFKTNQTYLSEFINRTKGVNFSSYIHHLRINYLLNELNNDPKLLTYKISYLAEISGYSSYETFTRIFKSIVGLSPSAYIKQLKKM